MGFRTRLTLFFALIVVVPMIALGVVVARLVSDSERGKLDARSRAYAAASVRSYEQLAARGARDARTLAQDDVLLAALTAGDAASARARARDLADRLGLARVRIARAGAVLADLGDARAIAGGAAHLPGGLTVETSSITADEFARSGALPGVELLVHRDGRVLGTTLPAVPRARLPERGDVELGDATYSVTTFHGVDFGGRRTAVAILADTRAASDAAARGRWIAVALLAAFLILAFAGALLISRQLHGQLERFLAAAKRIGGGDFSATVPIEGDDEFAQLGREFNAMSRELEQRVRELDQERARLRESIQRVGAPFASNLDRGALLEIGMQTIVDAVQAACGRATLRAEPSEGARIGQLAGAQDAMDAAEAQVGPHTLAAVATVGGVSALAAPIPQQGAPERPHGIVAVARAGRPFGDDERELVASLARQTGISLENVDLHELVKRQAVTDELTGLYNHGRFQQTLAAEAAAARRFDQPLGLVLLDIDDFKHVNDTYGHLQGDLVLREVARILREYSREVDEPARYGGEEMVVALQQTDLDGAEAIAERIRTAVEALELPLLDRGGTIRVTVSLGVAASAQGDPQALVAAADAALYAAKRSGKNRTVRADALPVAGGAG